jgi:2-hydroxychromene-2-carboxylate isomerase
MEAFEFMPYWDPDEQTRRELEHVGGQFHYVQMSRAKHLYILMDTKRLAQAEGIAMAWPIDVDPFWELAHLGWLRARAIGRATAFYDEVIDARWGRAEDIGLPEVIAGCAERAGLDPAYIVEAHKDEGVRVEAVDCLYQAYLDDIFAVPYVKWGGHRFWGLDRLGAFLQMWPEGRPAPAPEQPAGMDRAYDTDQAGGCG